MNHPPVRYAKTPMIYLSLLLERIAYYGLRSFMVLFLVAAVEEGGAEMSRIEALTFYGTFTTVVYFATFFGGVLADFVAAKHKVATSGMLIVALAVGICLLIDSSMVTLTLLLAALGFGMTRPVLSAMLAEQYRNEPEKVDGRYYLFEFILNIGAFIAPLFVGSFFDVVGYSAAFVVILCVAVLAGVSVFLTVNREYQLKITASENHQSMSMNLLFALALLSAAYNFGFDALTAVFDKLKSSFASIDGIYPYVLQLFGFEPNNALPIVNVGFLDIFSLALLVLGFLLFAIIFRRTTTASGYKLSLGLFCFALAGMAIYFFAKGKADSTLFNLLLAAEVLLVMSELLFYPLINSIIAKSRTKAMATSFAALAVIGYFVNKFTVSMTSTIKTEHLSLAVGIAFAVAVVVWMVSHRAGKAAQVSMDSSAK